MPVTTVPLLSEHKMLFVWSRLLETLFGGLRLFVGIPVPCYAYAIQLLVYQFPIVVGSTFTILCETGVISRSVAAGSCCGAVVLGVGLLQLVAWRMQFRSSPVVSAQVNSLAILETNQVSFNSCCSWQTVFNLFSAKKYSINYICHTVLCGLLTGYGLLYLLPSRLSQELYTRIGFSYMVFVLGWCTLCNALYSLSVHPPFEPATFQPLDRWEFRPLMRPFYVALCYAIDGYSWSSSSLHSLNGLFHVIFILLPCLWFLNVLPPLDCLFLWILEQVQIWIAGGSPAANTTRLCLQLGLWMMSVIIILYIPIGALLLLATILGYLLSLDLVSMFCDFTSKFKSKSDGSSGTAVKIFWNCSDFLYFVIMLVAIIILSLCLQLALAQQPEQSSQKVILFCVGLALFLLCLTTWVANSIQSVYIFGGFLRNPLYPPNTRRMSKFINKLHRLDQIGKFRTVIVNIVTPLLLNAYMIILLIAYSTDMTSCLGSIRCKLWYSITIVRAFRWTWQQSESALFETTVVHFLLDAPTLRNLTANKACLLLLVAFIWDRAANFTCKLQTFSVLLLASVAQVKQRRPYSFYLFFLNLMCLPFTIGMMLFSALISAPILPLFTLPIFWFGFPRPMSFWPQQRCSIKASSSTDEIYYEEVAPKICKVLGRLLSNGGLGKVRPGDHFLLRFQDRLLWMSVAEMGHGYARLDAKGLELQQTSCHSVEAAAMDAILELAFEVETEGLAAECGHCNTSCGCRTNRTICHLYRPLNVAVVDTYVDTRNVLTGVIHSPQTLQLITASYPQCLTWVLVRHFFLRRRAALLQAAAAALLRPSVTKHKEFGVEAAKTIQLTSESTSDARISSTTRRAGATSATTRSRPSTAEGYARLPRVSSLYEGGVVDGGTALCVDDPWFDDDDDPLDTVPRNTIEHNSATVQLHSFFGMDDGDESSRAIAPVNEKHWRAQSLPGMVTDVPIRTNPSGRPQSFTVRATIEEAKSCEPPTPSVSSEFWALPPEWLTGPLSREILSSVESHFRSNWFTMVSGKLSRQFKSDEELTKFSQKGVWNNICEAGSLYRQVVLTCHVILNQISQGGKRAVISPSLVYRIFNREMPREMSLNSDWLLEMPELFDLAIKAFRYACKMALDQTLLGEVESDEEFADYLQEYDESWLICPDNDCMWIEAIRNCTPNLFSLGYNPVLGTYTSHLLVLRPVPIYIGKLNREAVLAIWSTLSLELLYLTNDDEERYSIQAHSGLLRNLIVQAADPPLGYPIFIEKDILVKTRPSESFASVKIAHRGTTISS